MTIPFGKTVPIELIATYEGAECYVEIKNSDVEFVLSDASLGVIDGFTFTATTNENNAVTAGTLTATINGMTAETVINLGKGSASIFDFESENAADDWFIYDYNVTHSGTSSNPDWDMKEGLIEVVTADTGKVHSGDSALAVTLDYSDAQGNGWIQYRMGYNGEYIALENAKKLGFWIWMPEEAYANEWDLHIRCIDANGAPQRLSPVLTDPGDCFQKQDEAGWRYYTTDISKYPLTYFGYYPDGTVSTALFYIQFYNYQQQWQSNDEVVNTQGKFTYFIDDITVEYSEAADDTDAPVFGTVNVVDNNGVITEMKGQTVRYNTFGAEVAVLDFAKANATGIDAESAKAYVDGKEVECLYASGRLSISGVIVADGLHTVKFVICDKMGNLNSIIRQVNVQANSGIPTINLVPHDETLTNLPSGSVYYVDLKASNIESVQSFVVDLDMVNTFTWHLDQAVVADGFKMSYKVEKYENVATITITKDGNVNATGSQVIASIPVRVWEESIDRGKLTIGGTLKELYLTIKCTKGILECTDGTVSTFTCDPMKIATELWMNQWNAGKIPGFEYVVLHEHVAEAVADKAATCTTTGYTGRTVCVGCVCTEGVAGVVCAHTEGCGSVVDWGTTIPALGHTFELKDGKLTCVNGGELFSGVHTDGKTYVDGVAVADGWNADKTAYYVDGVKLTGSHIIDKAVYTFDENGNYLPNNIYNGFITDDGMTMYFYTNTNYEPEYLYENDAAYYFVDGVAKEGEYTINGETCLFEGGKYISCSTADVMDAGWEGNTVTYIVYADGSMILGGTGETYKYTSRAQLPWYSIRNKVRSIFIGKNITSLGHYALADIYNAKTITFEEGSKLTYIGAGTFLSCYGITEIELPDSVQTIVQNSFKMCKNLVDVYLPQNIKYLNKLTFVNNQNVPMEKIKLHVYEGTYAEDYAKQYNIPYEYRVFVDSVIANGSCGANATWELYKSGRMIISGSGAMDNYTSKDNTPWAEHVLKITDVVIGKDITSIGNYAFAYAHNIKSVTFEEDSKLETIGAAGFMYMLYTTEVVLPETVTKIGNSAFGYCSRLANVDVPESVTLMYPATFKNCKVLDLTVVAGSYAEKYAVTNNISYTAK